MTWQLYSYSVILLADHRFIHRHMKIVFPKMDGLYFLIRTIRKYHAWFRGIKIAGNTTETRTWTKGNLGFIGEISHPEPSIDRFFYFWMFSQLLNAICSILTSNHHPIFLVRHSETYLWQTSLALGLILGCFQLHLRSHLGTGKLQKESVIV